MSNKVEFHCMECNKLLGYVIDYDDPYCSVSVICVECSKKKVK